MTDDATRDSEYHQGFRDWFDDNPTGGRAENLAFREVVDGLWLQPIQLGTGNAMTLRTDVGLVQVDAGMNEGRAVEMLTEIRRVNDDPVHAIVYSHGHLAYNEGVPAWLAHAEQ